jgi:hypothetical protein
MISSNDHRMPSPIFPLPWSNGPHDGWGGAVVLSVTDFQYRRQEDLEACAAIAMKLAATWPVMQGAVALRFWAMPDQLRIGALTAWQEKSDLQRFVRWPVHQDVVRQFRDLGTLGHATSTWSADRFDADGAWAEAEHRLIAGDRATA